jgi:hypothetical protein
MGSPRPNTMMDYVTAFCGRGGETRAFRSKRPLRKTNVVYASFLPA